MDIKKLKKIEEGIFQYKKIRIYANEKIISEMDNEVLRQAENVSNLNGLIGYVSILADAHWGYGFPIGGSAAFDIENQDGMISIGGVGFDINCGVRTYITDLITKDLESRKEALANILASRIPAGLGSEGFITLSKKDLRKVLIEGANWCVISGFTDKNELQYIEDNGKIKNADPDFVSQKALEREKKQLGTLGSGNHYLEVQVVEEIYNNNIAKIFGLFKDQIVITIHCGSRGLGHQIGTDYLEEFWKEAKRLKLNFPEREIVSLPFSNKIAQKYFKAVNCGINFAFANREVLGYLLKRSFKELFPSVKINLLYDVGHNTVKIENHKFNGKNYKLLVHRKGSTRGFGPNNRYLPDKYKKSGQPVIVGGSMGTSSYILAGTDKAMNYNFGTTIHGAGRVLSRRKARKEYRAENEIKSLERKGIIVRYHSIRSVAEEVPQAYKNIDFVIESIITSGISIKIAKLRPIIVIKG